MIAIVQVVVQVPNAPEVVGGCGSGGMPPEGVAIISLVAILAGVIVLWPLVRAWSRRIEGRVQPGQASLEEVEQLRQRLAQLEELPHRIAELEERADFAERLLTQSREAERLPGRGAP